jgi:thioredoxin-like negative regulator of GroEL
MSAVVDEIQKTHTGKFNLIDINVYNQAEAGFIGRFGVSSIPTSVFFDKTGKPLSKFMGTIEIKKLDEYLTGLEK